MAEYKGQAHYNIRRRKAKARYNTKSMQIEMLCDTVSPRLVMIRGCEYTRVKLATVYPLALIGGRSHRVSNNVRTVEETCAQIMIFGTA